MIETHENVFDRLWLSEVCDTLLNKEAWYANNVANRNTWPYGNDGTHRLLGINFFLRRNENHILTSSSNRKLTNDLINAFLEKTEDEDLLFKTKLELFNKSDVKNHKDRDLKMKIRKAKTIPELFAAYQECIT